ncbi:MAG: GDP-mannose 4,6-dehydratase [Planctomycetia bacterium]|nr:GDP-mannose 4,6-dehydratase [Planctomycetia bacterium]
MRILVTGASGFAGSHLVEALAARDGAEVFGVSRQPVAAPRPPLAGMRTCDLNDRRGLEQVLRDVQPERLFHLAGYAKVGRSLQESDAAWRANLDATRDLYEAVLRWGGRPRILHVTSGLIYGEAAEANAIIGEEAPLRPTNPYAASKAAADLASFQYGESCDLEIIRARAFNHIGPRQASDFAASSFARQIALAEQGKQAPLLKVGDLRPSRDLTDVRDTVRAYVLLMEQGKPGEAYNVGSGQAYAMQEVLNRLLAQARVNLEVRQDAKLLRAGELAVLRADAGKLRRLTGWTPRYTLDQTLTDLLDYWRQQP